MKGLERLFPLDLKSQLIRDTQAVIDQICQKQLGNMRHPPRIEIDFVSSFVENGASLIQAALQRSLSAHRIIVTTAGIFCHQSPMVEIKNTPPYRVPTQRCELADLLILHSHVRADGKMFWRGVLLQAKLNKGKSSRADEPQLWLYRDWPQFVIGSPGFDRRQRNFDGDPRSGQFALVSNGGWFVLPPAASLPGGSAPGLPFSEFLVEMLYDMDPAQQDRTSTHGRQVYNNSQRDWSPTIWELVRTTAARALSHKGKKRGLYHADLSRLGGNVLQLIQGDGDGEARIGALGPGGDEGISVLIIATTSGG